MNLEKYSDGKLKKIREINPIDEGISDVIIEGIVVGIGDIEHYTKYVVMKCPSCNEEYSFELGNNDDFRNFKWGDRCSACKVTTYLLRDTPKGMVRKLLIQEIDSVTPMDLTCYLFGEDTLLVEAGKKIAVRGTLRSYKKHKGDITLQRVFDINKLALFESKQVKINDEDVLKFKSLKKEDLIKSFAPKIMGMETIKEGLLITLIGGVNRTDVRGDINTFLVGDPGTAKTQLLRFITKIVDPSDYASGKSSSAAGLTAGVDNLSDGTRIARAGPVILCNDGVVSIDEMDKMNAHDRSALHEVMESQSYSLKKIGINRTWPARTTIIGAANPHGGNCWNTELSIKENIKLPDSLLSRFGLIFLIRDIPDKEKDLEIARHIMKVRQGIMNPPLNEEELKKFIILSKTYKPFLTDEAGEFLLGWWSELRLQKQDKESINVDRRVMEDLNRFAEAYARMRFSEKVELQDAKDAVILLNDSLHTLNMNTPGERSQSLVEYMNNDEFIRYIFNDPISEDQAIAKIMQHNKCGRLKAEKEVQSLRNFGNIIEMEDKLQWVS